MEQLFFLSWNPSVLRFPAVAPRFLFTDQELQPRDGWPDLLGDLFSHLTQSWGSTASGLQRLLHTQHHKVRCHSGWTAKCRGHGSNSLVPVRANGSGPQQVKHTGAMRLEKGYSLPRVADDGCPRSVLLFFSSQKEPPTLPERDSPSQLLLASRNVQPFNMVTEAVGYRVHA